MNNVCLKNKKKWWIFSWFGSHEWEVTSGTYSSFFSKWEICYQCELCNSTYRDHWVSNNQVISMGYNLPKDLSNQQWLSSLERELDNE